MKPVTFSPYISHIGIEFEGLYHTSITSQVQAAETSRYVDIGTDGTIAYRFPNGRAMNGEEGQLFSAWEVRTKPCNPRDLNIVLNLFHAWFIAEKYLVNDTCGLHFHISFTSPDVYAKVCTPYFYANFTKMVQTNFPHVYAKRAIHSYCEVDYVRRYKSTNKSDVISRHFRRLSGNKYVAINYQYDSLNTAEFRLFGGSASTIESLAQCIQDTINLIHQTANRKTTNTRKIFSLGITPSVEHLPISLSPQFAFTPFMVNSIDIHLGGKNTCEVVKTDLDTLVTPYVLDMHQPQKYTFGSPQHVAAQNEYMRDYIRAQTERLAQSMEPSPYNDPTHVNEVINDRMNETLHNNAYSHFWTVPGATTSSSDDNF